MKVIDLLNKIANGEEVKFKVLQSGEEYYIKKGNFLHNELGEEVNWYIDEEWLNLEVEIIEENKKIEKIKLDDWVEFTTEGDIDNLDYMFNKNSKTFVDKINEIIEVINNEYNK